MTKHENRQGSSAGKRRCKATTKRGTPCEATIVGPDGFCTAHSGRQDMRELGRKGGRGRSGPKPERVHPSLRAYLRANVSPAEIWTALQLALEGSNESARVGASRVLMDALAEPERDRSQADEMQALGERATAWFDEKLPRACRRVVTALLTDAEPVGGFIGLETRTLELCRADPALMGVLEDFARKFEEGLTSVLEAQLTELAASEGRPHVVAHEVDPAKVIEGLVEIGLLRVPLEGEATELATLRAENEQLRARLSEFTVTAGS